MIAIPLSSTPPSVQTRNRGKRPRSVPKIKGAKRTKYTVREIPTIEIQLNIGRDGETVPLPQPYTTKPTRIFQIRLHAKQEMAVGAIYDHVNESVLSNSNVYPIEFPSSIMARNLLPYLHLANQIKFLIRKNHTAKAFIQETNGNQWLYLAFGPTVVAEEMISIRAHEENRQLNDETQKKEEQKDKIRRVLENIDTVSIEKVVSKMNCQKRDEWFAFLGEKIPDLFREFIDQNIK